MLPDIVVIQRDWIVIAPRAHVTNASAADCFDKNVLCTGDRRKIWISSGWEKFGSGERALRVRLEKGRRDGRWWDAVARYKSFSPCSVIPESGYPFSDGARATIKLLLLAHSFIPATADRIYFVAARPGSQKRIASSDEGCGHRNCCSFRTDAHGQSERHPDSAVNIRLIPRYFVATVHYIIPLSFTRC